jgi:hypothetical protein
MARIHRLEIPLSAEELKKIKAKAESYGLSASSFARLILLNSQIKLIEVDLNNSRIKKKD